MRLIVDGRRLTAHRTGVGRYLEMLLSEWSRTELPIAPTRVVLSDPSGLALIPDSPGLEARVACPRLPGLLWEHFGLGREVRKGDILFAPANLVPASWRGPTALALHDCLLEARPGDFSHMTRWRFGRRYRAAARRADVIFVLSEATARDVIRYYGVTRSRLRVIHPAPDPAFRPPSEASGEVHSARETLGLGDSPFFLFVGKTSRRRNVGAVLEGFAVHRAAFPVHRLVFVGGRPEKDIPEGTILAGHVSEPILRGLYGSALGVLYPSEHEGYGLPVVEAMACGCPVVTLRRDALIEAGGDGPIYLEQASPESLATAMGDLANNEGLRRDHVRRGLVAAARVTTAEFAGNVRRELRALAGEGS